MTKVNGHRDLLVWQKGIQLVKLVYQATNLFPNSELYGLTSQLNRCAVSIPSNIAEGCGRETNAELIHFLYISLGSAAELETQVIIANDLKFIAQNQSQEILLLNNEIVKMLVALINKLKTSK